jgi:hypothetical protein
MMRAALLALATPLAALVVLLLLAAALRLPALPTL